ncbi:aromatic ring-hydroxylating oxygenase subunit alpha [Methylophaga sp. OBS4]|uniref:aromatic ring-hydroxylating oxygenase subunit alpha n=1 Tax=Methylophaga sp. OBS4 TaxID=2991935 RepID=UPI0022556113|nr:aromatic ring-hydroxylating dioxygenase subunit alpha [Methylophaga sp. OBS4]MCX4187738.1 aromatic ring-hydroxylating dioxygenase subunit alpha [Methylophaga sp. OBS4]MCX4187743.1 aromatic ring-hydroxylating dioxygenase subunit alpha [Methylophaga sp. OBS4]
MNPSKEIRRLISERRKGYTLEAPFYRSQEIFDLDIAAIFSRHWIYVAVEPDIPEPGDYVRVEVGHNSIIIVRDDDMAIQAFHNVCRHRGSQLCDDFKGSVGNLVCPYHQWTYDLSGKLIYNEHMGETFDQSQHNLKPVHVRSVAGLIFICLADEPPGDFEEMRAAMEPYITPHRLTDCKVVWQEEVIEEGNWKLTMENNRECYHCMANHPELTVSMYEYGFGYQPSHENADKVQEFQDLIVSEGARWEACGLPSTEIDLLDGRATAYRTQRLPLDKAGESQTMDSKVACQKLLGDLTNRNLGGLSFWTQPNSWHHFMSDHIVTFSVLPVDAEHTLLRTKWLVHKDAVEGVDYDLKQLSEVWRATNKQDSTLVERTHRGVSSEWYEPGPYSPYTEELVEKFTNWYIQRLEAELPNVEAPMEAPIKVCR